MENYPGLAQGWIHLPGTLPKRQHTYKTVLVGQGMLPCLFDAVTPVPLCCMRLKTAQGTGMPSFAKLLLEEH